MPKCQCCGDVFLLSESQSEYMCSRCDPGIEGIKERVRDILNPKDNEFRVTRKRIRAKDDNNIEFTKEELKNFIRFIKEGGYDE